MSHLSKLLLCLMALAYSMLSFAALSVPGALDRIVAVVNEDVVTALELEAEMARVKDQLRLQKTRAPSDEVLAKQLLERIIVRQIQLQIAERQRIRVDDETLNKTLENIAASNKLSLPQFRETLQREGINFAAFRENMRKEIIVSRLQSREVNNRISITEQEIDNFLINEAVQNQSNTEYRLGHILIAVPEAANAQDISAAKERAQQVIDKLRGGKDFAQSAVAESDGQQALEGGDLGWRRASALPTLFVNKALQLELNEVSDPIRSPSGFHVIKLLEKRVIQPQHMITQTHARHILIRSDEFTSSIDALNRIKLLRQRLESGEDFVPLATAHSDDTVSGVKGGDLGWINPGDMVAPFEQAMGGLALNVISEPVQTRFGWHLIEVLERREHDDTAAIQRNKARETIRVRKIEPAMETWIRRLRENAFVENRLSSP